MTPRTVWLASYPKSGNTWVRAMMAALDQGSVDLNTMRRSVIASARAPLERLTGLVSSELSREEAELLRPLVDAQLDGRGTAEEGLWHRKIHDALFTEGGTPIIPPEATRAAIYLVRDPRDVAVSYSHHRGTDIAEIVRSMASPSADVAGYHRRVHTQFRQHLGTWSSHVEGWLDHELFPVVLVRFEDILANPVAQLARIANTLGREATTEQLEAAVAATSFNELRTQEIESGFHEGPHRERAFFRRGIAGAWRDELPLELAAQIESDHGRVMARLGYLADASVPASCP
jgi:aryl sulfotransferase